MEIKWFVYFAMFFSLIVTVLQMRYNRNLQKMHAEIAEHKEALASGDGRGARQGAGAPGRRGGVRAPAQPGVDARRRKTRCRAGRPQAFTTRPAARLLFCVRLACSDAALTLGLISA